MIGCELCGEIALPDLIDGLLELCLLDLADLAAIAGDSCPSGNSEFSIF